MRSVSNRVPRWLELHGDRGDIEAGEDDVGPFFHTSNPNVLASFVAFCRVPLKKARIRVFMRGEASEHPPLVPSLFRKIEGDSEVARFDAYSELVSRIPGVVRGTRWRKERLGAVLQHYGIKTPWVDLVDDLSTAIWFALHTFDDSSGSLRAIPSPHPHSWVHFVAELPPSVIADLRTEQSSMNWRCHAQQGYSIARVEDGDSFSTNVTNLGDLVIARVRIPNDDSWRLSGFRASQAYLFPSRSDDSTYVQLLEDPVAELLEEVEDKHSVKHGALGRVAVYD